MASYKTNTHSDVVCVWSWRNESLPCNLNNSASASWLWKLCCYSCPRLRQDRGLSQVLWSTGLTNMKAFTKASRQQCKNISPKHKFLNCSLLICSCDYPTKSIRYVNGKSKHLSELFQKPFASQPYIYQQFEYRLSITNPLRRTESFLIDRSRALYSLA